MDQPVIAIVDDDGSVCTSVQRLLRSAGLSATTFNSGEAFLASLKTAPHPDCVVLDLSMPVVDGLAVLASLNESGLSLPVIFISAMEQAEPRRQALAAGAVAFLQKPCDGQVLLNTIALALGRTRA